MTVKVHVHLNNPSLYALRATPFLQQEVPGAQWVDAPLTTTEGRGQDLRLLQDGTADIVGTGVTPPLTGQGLGVELTYLGYSDPRPDHGAIVVAAESTIGTVADLRGGVVEYGIGSWQTHFLAAALDRVGGSLADVEGVASDAQSLDRVRSGTSAAVILQNAEYRAAVADDTLRVLGTVGDEIPNRSLWFARTAAVRENIDAVAAVAGAIVRANEWASGNIAELARVHADDVGGTEHDWSEFLADVPWSFHAVDDAFVTEQQAAADLLHRAGLLPRPIRIVEAVNGELNSAVSALVEAPIAARKHSIREHR